MRSRTVPQIRLVSSALLLAVGLLCGPRDARALHRESPPAVRITSGGTHAVSPSRSWNFQVVFSSDQDLLGTGATGRQIYLYSQFDYDCQLGLLRPDIQNPATPCPEPPHPYLVQLTTGPGNPDNPSIDNVGRYVAFDADGTFDGGAGPQAAHRQIFVLDRQKGLLVRVTNAADGDSVQPSVDVAGGMVVFQSTAGLLGRTTHGISQIFAAVALRTGQPPQNLLQLTSGAGPSVEAIPDRAGGAVSFASTADLLGDGRDTGISQVFVANVDRSVLPPHVTVHQITKGNGPSLHPYLTSRNDFVVFQSVASNLPGSTDPGGSNVYMAPVTGPGPPSVTQLTTYKSFGECTFPRVDVDGTRVLFLCTGDPLQNGSTGRRAFALDLTDQTLFQLTSRGDVEGPIDADFGHNFIVLSDTTDLTGGEACGRQLYVLDYYPSPGHWRSATHQGELPADQDETRPNNDVIGTRTFLLQHGDGNGGSVAKLATATGTTTIPLVTDGAIELDLGAPDPIAQQAPVSIPANGVTFPAIDVPGFGTLCISPAPPTGSNPPGVRGPVPIGKGVLDCRGGRTGVDLAIDEDHDVNAANPQANPLCVAGCPEGATNLPDACENRVSPLHPGVCNGPEVVQPGGTFRAGDMLLELPVLVALQTQPDFDGVFCNANQGAVYAWKDLPTTLRLTTSQVTTTLHDANDVVGATIAATSAGSPFDCDRLAAHDLSGSALTGMVHLFDVPNVGAVADLVLTLNLVPQPPPPCFDCACPSAPCADGTSCGAPTTCGGTPTCENHTCTSGTPLDCDDGNPCTDDSCDPNGGCRHDPNTAACDDGNVCTSGDVCQGGTCRGVAAADGTACTDPCLANATCQAGACTGTARPDGASCSDGDVCNGAETCRGGTCTAGTPLACDDANPCTRDGCAPETGCFHEPLFGQLCSDGDACTQFDFCQGGTCQGFVPVVCSAEDDCHNAGTCDAQTGVCSNPEKADGSACNDGSVCTIDDTCHGGVCEPGAPMACAPADQCHQAGVCDPETGCASAPVTDGTPCDDGSACTTGDICRAGVCVGTAIQCNDGDPCNGVETCDAANGTCVAGPSPNCDDTDPCTVDSCVPGTGCAHTPVTDLPQCRVRQAGQALTALAERIAGTPPPQLGGKARKRHLARLVNGARHRLEAALAAKAGHAGKALEQATRRLGLMAQLLEQPPGDAAMLRKLDAEAVGDASLLSQIRALVA